MSFLKLLHIAVDTADPDRSYIVGLRRTASINGIVSEIFTSPHVAPTSSALKLRRVHGRNPDSRRNLYDLIIG
jgi:hypothetical protein